MARPGAAFACLEGDLTNKAISTLAGATLLALVLGSLHAFSVLIEPIEGRLGATRASVSLVYSLATLSLVAGVFFTSRLLHSVSPAFLAVAACISCTAGLGLAAQTSGLAGLYAGFGMVFGFANGIGYALSIERSGAAYPEHKGVVTGIVTAAYCAGAVIFSKVFGWYAAPDLYHEGLLILAITINFGGLIAGLLLKGGPAPVLAQDTGNAEFAAHTGRIVLLWSIYFLGVTSGLMALGHAAAVVSAAGGSTAQLAAGAMIVSVGSAAGSIACGWMADRTGAERVLTGSLLLVVVSMILLSVATAPGLIIAALGLTGFAYGALITIIPVVVSRSFQPEVSLKAFGRVFTAWGVAGLAGPWLAGVIFDADQRYVWAFVLAAAGAGVAAILSRFCVGSRNQT